jgi:pimeloyl-ACP methyl ester carboxylesterase
MGSPDALAGIVLIDTGTLPGYKWHTLARVWRTPVLGELFQAASRGRPFTRGLASKEPRGLPAEFLRSMGSHYDRRTKRAVLKLYRATDDPGAVGEGLAAIMAPRKLPALVIWGEEDAYLPAAYAERQRDAFPAADVHVLPESGHWPFADSPETVERLLIEYLEGAAGSAARSAG